MKKSIVIALGVFMMIALSSASWAEKIGNATIDFTPSPSSVMDADVSAAAFSITSASTKTTTDNGIDYLLISTDGFIYQKTQATKGGVTDAPSSTTDPIVTTNYSVKGS